MATRSILKNVDFKERSLSRSFISALENAKHKSSKDVTLSRTYTEVTGDKIKQLFGDKS